MARLSSNGITAIAVSAVFDVVGTLSTVLRFTSKLHTRDPVHKDDICVLIGWFCSIGMSINLWLECQWAFRLGDHTSINFEGNFENFLLVNYIVEPFYTLSVGFTKFSIAFLYLRLFGTLAWMRKGCNIALILVGLWTVACVIIGLVQCIPVRKAWDQKVPGGCIDISIFFVCQRATNLVTDLLLLGLPIKVVLGLNASLPRRLSLLFGFCIGFLVCIATAYTLGLTVHFIGRTVGFNDYRSLIWTVVELEVGVLCANLPTCYALLIRIIPESWRDSLADRVETLANTRRGFKSGRQSAQDRGPDPSAQYKSKSLASWVKGDAVIDSKAYAMEEMDHASINSDAGILRKNNNIYVRHEIEVADSQTGESRQGHHGW